MRKITIGYPLIKLETVDSTNAYATQMLRTGQVTEGTVILAVNQTQGKGQGGNRWISEPGSNLLLSLILRPDFILAERQFFLSMCVSNAIQGFLEPVTSPVRIKWPNDILVQGRKIAGILIENTILNQNLHTSVVGIGLNVNQQDFPDDLPDAVSLRRATGMEYNLSDTLDGLLASLTIHLTKLYEKSYAEIKTTYLNNLWGLNAWAWYSDASGAFEGRIVDVADSGELVVMNRKGTAKAFGFKEIKFPA
jgi:BirA family transcriptional regulator, biotin operon repressor / biotin---[acetyl-CoA-carboxylase] ligase